mmetsp:Transcript_15237/g.36074  ORF Transcript_15237/g.36074 Transcript_15237/m.36074 type:complete len:242 (+) Transcript_15237:721-1446(+)
MSTSSKGSCLSPPSVFSMTVGQPMYISKPSRRIVSMSTVRCSRPRPETRTVSPSSVSSTRRATLVSSSLLRRSRMLREVSSLPARPAKGDLLTPKVMDMDGCSTSIGSSGMGSSGSTSVSPMVKSCTPEKTTISPAEATSMGARPIASKLKSSETLTWRVGVPGPCESAIGVFFLIDPERMRPMPSRPMNESMPMLEICSWSGPSTFALGLGSSMMRWKIALMSSPMASGSRPATRLMAEQ